MHSLHSLRDTVLKQLQLEPENVSSFTEDGTLRSHYERKNSGSNSHFRLEYTATLLLINCTKPIEHVMHIVGQWLHDNQPSHDPKAISFEAEILDNNSADLKISIEGITDTYKPSVTADGTLIVGCSNQPADPIIRADGLMVIEGHPVHG
ncbi:phage tail protein [Psychrobacter celer]|uniref:phage tail protein n=1 Tax=Psychrobacter celer TaxID=306572 RepID=UPI003FCF35FD